MPLNWYLPVGLTGRAAVYVLRRLNTGNASERVQCARHDRRSTTMVRLTKRPTGDFDNDDNSDNDDNNDDDERPTGPNDLSPRPR